MPVKQKLLAAVVDPASVESLAWATNVWDEPDDVSPGQRSSLDAMFDVRSPADFWVVHLRWWSWFLCFHLVIFRFFWFQQNKQPLHFHTVSTDVTSRGALQTTKLLLTIIQALPGGSSVAGCTGIVPRKVPEEKIMASNREQAEINQLL